MQDTELQPLVKVTQHNIALLFCDYLKTLQIRTQVEKEDRWFCYLLSTR